MALNRRSKIFIAIAAIVAVIVIVLLVVFFTRSSGPSLVFAPNYSEIRFNASKADDVQKYIYALDEFVNSYKQQSTTNNKIICSGSTRLLEHQSCKFDVNVLNECTKANSYGYKVVSYKNSISPCILLRLDGVKDWTPEFFNSSNNLPYDLPEGLKDHITYNIGIGFQIQNVVWVSCAGETQTDNQALGPISYYPEHGFEAVYFPPKNADQDAIPIVAVHLERAIRRTRINVVCKAWAKNLPAGQDTIKFQLYLE